VVYFDDTRLSGGVVKFLLILLVNLNVALVTYLLGNIKKELDRLSWIIIGIAILGSLMGTLRAIDYLGVSNDGACGWVA
jgi:hypothetical protein